VPASAWKVKVAWTVLPVEVADTVEIPNDVV
jgi:hypothetical protein